MATLLDVGLLKGLSGIFPLLFIFAVLYALLIRLDFFKEKQLLAAVIAIVLAFAGLLTPIVAKTILIAAPFFVLLFIFAVLSILVYTSFGLSQDTVLGTLTGSKWGTTFGLWMLALILIITIGSFSAAVSEEKGFLSLRENSTAVPGAETSGFFNVITHPKVLGMALILLTSMFAIKYLTENP